MIHDERPCPSSTPAPGAADSEPSREWRAHIRSVRLGHGANCSSVGSVVDLLFASAVATSALLGAVAAALDEESAQGLRPDDAEPGTPIDAPNNAPDSAPDEAGDA